MECRIIAAGVHFFLRRLSWSGLLQLGVGNSFRKAAQQVDRSGPGIVQLLEYCHRSHYALHAESRGMECKCLLGRRVYR
jgi:hypothetical protein